MEINQDFNQPRNFSEETVHDQHVGWKAMGERIYNDTGILIQREMSLIRAEFREKILDLRKGSVALGLGLALILLSVFSLMATLIMLLGTFIPLWVAGLSITVLFFIVGFGLYKGGKEKFDMEELRPHHSLEALNEMKKIVKENYYEFKSGPKQ